MTHEGGLLGNGVPARLSSCSCRAACSVCLSEHAQSKSAEFICTALAWHGWPWPLLQEEQRMVMWPVVAVWFGCNSRCSANYVLPLKFNIHYTVPLWGGSSHTTAECVRKQTKIGFNYCAVKMFFELIHSPSAWADVFYVRVDICKLVLSLNIFFMQ